MYANNVKEEWNNIDTHVRNTVEALGNKRKYWTRLFDNLHNRHKMNS